MLVNGLCVASALVRLALLLTCAAAQRGLSLYDWPNVIGNAQTLFDRGSQYGYNAFKQNRDAIESFMLRGPIPDWAMGSNLLPTVAIDTIVAGVPSGIMLNATLYPGLVELRGISLSADIQLTATLVFVSANASLLKIEVSNVGQQPVKGLRLALSGSAPNVSGTAQQIAFDLPGRDSVPGKCFRSNGFHQGALHLPKGQGPWAVSTNNSTPTGSFSAVSSEFAEVAVGTTSTAFVVLTAGLTSKTSLPEGSAVAFDVEVARWEAYLARVLRGRPSTEANFHMQYVAVKAMQTLLHNWRGIPGSPNDGVLPSYQNYDSGMWSWDTYKQAVGMVDFAPDLAKQQIRVLIAGRDMKTGHIPDKIDRCGVGGGCSGKPPLLSWSVWEVYLKTKDIGFLEEMYPRIEQFHSFWYLNRDVQGVGFCSWTGGMESGMDDGIRFINATHATNETSHTSAFNFHSIDLNAYLYREKRMLAKMAVLLNNASAADKWAAQADSLLPRLQSYFFVSSSEPFFQDIYYTTSPRNLQRRTAGQPVPVQGCEGYAALFCEVATLRQALAMALTLSDSERFLLNFSLPTASRANPNYGSNTYWRGSTWIDQVWFAYTGLNIYANKSAEAGDTRGAKRLSALATEIKHRTFARGQGFGANDTVPLNEHYNPETGQAIGAQHFSWTAAHILMWTGEEFDNLDQQHGAAFPGAQFPEVLPVLI